MRVLVVSNHTIIRLSLISLLQKLPMDEPVSLSACAANEVVERARAWGPDLILFELTTDRDRASGISRIRTLGTEIPDAHIVVLGRDADEQEVFNLVRQGKRSREISEGLSIAESTVYKHIQNILDKLQVHSRAQAIFIVDSPDEYVPLDGRERVTCQ